MKLGNFIPLLCILFGIVESEDTVDSDCNFYQDLEPNINYYVYNPDYPDYYIGEHTCRWIASSNTRVKLNCSIFDIPPTANCSMDYIKVDVGDGIEYKFCGLNSFVVESISSKMTITFHSEYNTYGGKFRCDLRAVEDQCRCGWKNPSRIVGGVETGVNEYPMMAGIVSFETYLLFCGATIISPNYVLTAAHCVKQYDSSNLGIIVGEHNVRTGNETDVTRLHMVEKIIIHPKYQTKRNDIAVIKSQSKFEYSMKVGPACLPFYYMQRNFTNQVVTALGWGTTSFGGPKSDVLMKVDLHVISTKQCNKKFPDVRNNQLCTFDKGKDACQFDSGGPILWQNPRTNRVFDLGVISYGSTCADNSPGVNTKISDYLDFIRKSTPGETYCQVY
ncbi:venom serine protease-like [Vespa crabro]|uniref:venom serine protease-like n=1 Tax=Vespa crabro TaxID=7445 RepID=UPI001EFFC94C|nr:venom serine protease-like [Vespa crabro]